MHRIGALVVGGMLVVGLTGGSFAECQGDHGTPQQKASTAAAAPKAAPGQPAKQPTVVTGAPGHDVTVKAPASESVTAIGGAGTPGRAGTPAGRSQ